MLAVTMEYYSTANVGDLVRRGDFRVLKFVSPVFEGSKQ